MRQLTDWIFFALAAAAAVVVFWHVALPFLRPGSIDPAAVPEPARHEIEQLLDLGNQRAAAERLRAAVPMSAGAARRRIAAWAKRRASSGSAG